MTLKKMIFSIAALFCLCLVQAQAQQVLYSVSNAHAHNDYEHPLPFYTAYNAGFGSIEADVILYHGQLCVSHDTAGISSQRTLQSLYLDPLQKAIKKNNGSPYAEKSKALFLLIDFKTPVLPTMEALLQTLKTYKTITGCSNVKIVITGNRPSISTLASYPSYIYFDGDISKTYELEALGRVVLFSEDFRRYTKWKGEGSLPDSARVKLEAAITKAHRQNKPIRFWAAPDTPNTWRQLMALNIDYINTDEIAGLSEFMKKQRQSGAATNTQR